MMKIPSPLSLEQIRIGMPEKPNVPVASGVSISPRRECSFQAALKEQVQSSGLFPDRHASSGDTSVSELANLLRRQINEHFLSLLSSVGRTMPHSGRIFSMSLVVPNRIGGPRYGQNIPSSEVGADPAVNMIDKAINHASAKFGVDSNLVRAVIKAESDFRPEATSSKGAMGLMQLMPGTARDMGVRNPYNPVENIMGGVRYLKMLLDRYEGNVSRALAAYNWGMGNLERSGGGLPGETRTYVSRVNRFYQEFSSVDHRMA